MGVFWEKVAPGLEKQLNPNQQLFFGQPIVVNLDTLTNNIEHGEGHQTSVDYSFCIKSYELSSYLLHVLYSIILSLASLLKLNSLILSISLNTVII